LARVGGLGEGGDAVTGDETMVGHGVQGRAHAADGVGGRLEVDMVGVFTRDLAKTGLLGTTGFPLATCYRFD
jgi:hypothetical protein